MNGARRGAPGAGAFGAFRPPPPPGSQFTPSRSPIPSTPRLAVYSESFFFTKTLLEKQGTAH